MKRLRQLEEENNRLKRTIAELSLDKEMLPDVMRRKLYGLLAAVCSLTIRGPDAEAFAARAAHSSKSEDITVTRAYVVIRPR